jgi:hypothetical protein
VYDNYTYLPTYLPQKIKIKIKLKLKLKEHPWFIWRIPNEAK